MKTPDYVLGIDPGMKGALALLRCSDSVIETVFDMPTKDGKVDEID